MSGGFWEYKDFSLKTEIFGFGDTWHNVLEDREISELVFDIFGLLHEFDYYKSGDTGEDSYLKAKAEFKKKWLDNRGVRVKRIVDAALKDLKEELYKTYSLEDES